MTSPVTALGILLPVERGPIGYYNQGLSTLSQVKSNLTNLILTRRGERVMQPEFGCRVHDYLFENITDDLVSNIRGSIEEAIQIWMPFLTVENIDVVKDEDRNQIFVTITYSIKARVRTTDTVTLVL